jgi:hypothetical protein
VEVDATWKGGKAVSGALRPAVGGEFKLRPPHGQSIANIRSGGRTIEATVSGGVWQVRLEPRKEYKVTFE